MRPPPSPGPPNARAPGTPCSMITALPRARERGRRPVMRPLPMSLEPIPGESLVSYLLRLAYRLSLPPLHLARMTGWANGPRRSHVARKLLLDIAPPQAGAFARLTRLTTGE